MFVEGISIVKYAVYPDETFVLDSSRKTVLTLTEEPQYSFPQILNALYSENRSFEKSVQEISYAGLRNNLRRI